MPGWCYSVKAAVSGYPREAEKGSATGAGRLWECENTEFVQQWVYCATVDVLCNSGCTVQQWVFCITVGLLCNSG